MTPRPASTLYIHIPFCRSKCAYCDFYSMAGRQPEYEEYVEAVLAEWRLRRGELPCAPQTIYLGGGTPSLLPLGNLEKLLAGLQLRPARMLEVTIEANPEDVTPRWIQAVSSMGISRISIGVQSFSSTELRAIGRRHSPDEALRALDALSASGINYSADLIYGLPAQSLPDWEENLRRLLAYRPPHFSAYLLSYEPGTPLYARLQLHRLEQATDRTALAMYTRLCHCAARAGYHHYEISNFSQPGREAIHNSAYWDSTPYLGLGPGAHSLDKGGVRRFNPSAVSRYISALRQGRTLCVIDPETPQNRANDIIITALRRDCGLDLTDIDPRFRPEVMQNARRLVSQGCLIHDGPRLIIPEHRWLTADAILRDLII